MQSAGSLTELATKIGVPPAALRRTVTKYNEDAIAGVDTLFHCGESAYDLYNGDVTQTNPSPLPLHVGPFYAFRIMLSNLGTNGGVVTDKFARALREEAPRRRCRTSASWTSPWLNAKPPVRAGGIASGSPGFGGLPVRIA